jgi:hypothetical protein
LHSNSSTSYSISDRVCKQNSLAEMSIHYILVIFLTFLGSSRLPGTKQSISDVENPVQSHSYVMKMAACRGVPKLHTERCGRAISTPSYSLRSVIQISVGAPINQIAVFTGYPRPLQKNAEL